MPPPARALDAASGPPRCPAAAVRQHPSVGISRTRWPTWRPGGSGSLLTAHRAYQHTLWEFNLATAQTVTQRPDRRQRQRYGGPAAARCPDLARLAECNAPLRDWTGTAPTTRDAWSARRSPARVRWSASPQTTSASRNLGSPGESVRDDSIYVATGNGTPFDQVDDSEACCAQPDLTVESISPQ